MAQPKTKGEELLRDIKRLDTGSGVIDEFTLRRLWQRARELDKHAPIHASLAMAALCRVDHDPEGARQKLDRYTSMSGQSAGTFVNRGSILGELWQDEEAIDAAMQGLEHSPNEPKLLKIAMGSFLASGRLSEAEQICDIYVQRVGRDELSEDTYGIIHNVQEVLSSKGLTEEDLQEIARVTRQVSAEHGIHFRELASIQRSQDDGDPWISMMIVPGNTSQRERLRLGRDLVRRLSQAELPAFEKGAVIPRFTAPLEERVANA